MLFHLQDTILRIESVAHMSWEKDQLTVAARPYSALVFRIRGEAVLRANGQTYTLQPSDILYMPQALAYEAVYTDTEILAIHFITQQNDPAPFVFSAADDPRFFSLFSQALASWQSKKVGYTLSVMADLYRILSLLCEKTAKAELPPHFIKALSLIHAGIEDPALSLAQVCQSAGISPSSLRKLFQKYYGQSPISYLIHLRLDHARELIAGGCPIQEAALQSGFSDSKYFARLTKEKLGCSPSQLKNYGK